jgi:hypothetical protein
MHAVEGKDYFHKLSGLTFDPDCRPMLNV